MNGVVLNRNIRAIATTIHGCTDGAATPCGVAFFLVWAAAAAAAER